MFACLSSLKRVASLLVPLLAWLLVLSGCGEPERLPPEEVIRRAVPAIQAADSFHFTMETSKVQKPSGFFISKAEGDVAKPDKLTGSLNALYSGVPINVKVVVDGKSQYMTDPASGRWTTMSPAFNVAQFFDPTKGVSDILSSVEDPQVDGNETIDGVASYRLKGKVPASALKSLSPEVTAEGELATTLWIGSEDFLLRRVQLQGPIIAGEPEDITRTITLSRYNQEVKIETPVVK